MQEFKNILYVFNIKQSNIEGLKRAAWFAKKNQCCLAVIVNIEEETKKLMTDSSAFKTKINNTITSIVDQDQKIDVLFTTGVALVEIIKKVVTNKYDLVVTELEEQTGIKEFFYGTTTLSLLRKCPSPIWIVRPSTNMPYKQVMAAIDPLNNMIEPESTELLTSDILQSAELLAQLDGAKLSVVHAINSELEMDLQNPFLQLSVASIAKALEQEEQDHKQAFMQAIRKQKFSLAADQLHVLKGKPAEVIAEFVQKAKIDLIVMGSIQKAGLQGFLMGNTAERLLHLVNCSILALKPADYLSTNSKSIS